MIYRFGAFELDTAQVELRRNGEPVAAEPQVLAILELLISNAERLVSKQEINEQVWAGRIVSDAAVNSRIRTARQLIGDDGTSQRLIRTVRNRGFRFVGEVSRAAPEATAVWVEAAAPSPARVAGDPTASRARPTIAVLPFHAPSRDSVDQGVGDALAHELIVALSRYRWLDVIARGSSFRFSSETVDLARLRELLGVRYVAAGMLTQRDDRYALVIELSETASERIVWTERFDLERQELLGIRNDLAEGIAARIESHVEADAQQLAARQPTESLDAWQAYFRGLWHMYRFNAHDNAIAAERFRQALSLDPNFARALGGLSFTHFQNVFLNLTEDRDGELDRATETAEQALALDRLDPFVNLTMGRTHIVRGDWDASLPWLERAVEINPSYALAHYHCGWTDAVIGNGIAGEKHTARAIALSPLDPMLTAICASRALALAQRGDFGDALTWAERGVSAPGAHVHIFAIASAVAWLADDHAAAARWRERARKLVTGFRAEDFLARFPLRNDDLRKAAILALD